MNKIMKLILLILTLSSTAQAAEYACSIQLQASSGLGQMDSVSVIVDNSKSRLGTQVRLYNVNRSAFISIKEVSSDSPYLNVSVFYTQLNAEQVSSTDDFSYTLASKGQKTILLSSILNGVRTSLDCELTTSE